MGISTDEFRSIERGKTAPSLPQLEALAYYLDVPVEHFWSIKVLADNRVLDATTNQTLRRLRDRYLGTRLRQLAQKRA